MQSALYVGRFQPFHKGHFDIVKKILDENERIIIAIGSAELNYQILNPLTSGERFQLIEETLRAENIPAERYCIIPVRNINNYAIWVNHINIYVPPYSKIYTGSPLVKACYEGKYSEETRTNKLSAEIVEITERLHDISATKVRKAILQDGNWQSMVPEAVAKKLTEWNFPKRLKDISVREHRHDTPYEDL